MLSQGGLAIHAWANAAEAQQEEFCSDLEDNSVSVSHSGETAMRIVSLVPSITETLFALGLGSDEIVGRTAWCVSPEAEVLNVRIVGGTKTPSLRSIEDLRPDLVVLEREPGNGDALGLLGVIAGQRGKEREAVEFLRGAVAGLPGNIEHKFNLAKTLHGAGLRDEAIEMYRETVALDPARVSVRPETL